MIEQDGGTGSVWSWIIISWIITSWIIIWRCAVLGDIIGKDDCVGEEESVRFNMVAGQTSMHLRNCDLRLKQSLQRTWGICRYLNTMVFLWGSYTRGDPQVVSCNWPQRSSTMASKVVCQVRALDKRDTVATLLVDRTPGTYNIVRSASVYNTIPWKVVCIEIQLMRKGAKRCAVKVKREMTARQAGNDCAESGKWLRGSGRYYKRATTVQWAANQLHSSYSLYIPYCILYYVPVFHCWIVGLGGALVESMPFDRTVVGSNPALAAT